jgi:hypothetical protein
MTEQWKEVPGWEGFYAVSDRGHVMSLARRVPGRPGVFMNRRERIQGQQINRDGYAVVSFSRHNKKTEYRVQRLVLLAFVGPCPEGMEACHNNGNRSDNRVENLRWDTRSGNTWDRIAHGTHVQARKTHCANGHPYSEDNTYISPGKYGRHCRTCRLAQKRAYNERKKAAA